MPCTRGRRAARRAAGQAAIDRGGTVSLANRAALAAEILGGRRRVGIRIQPATLMFYDLDTRKLLRFRPDQLTMDQARQLRGSRPPDHHHAPPPNPPKSSPAPPLADYRTVEYHADRLAEAPNTLGEPYSRHLRGAVRELRFHLGRSAWRISYWLAPQQRIVLLTVFRKTRGRETGQVERAAAAQRVCEEQHKAATHAYDREG